MDDWAKEKRTQSADRIVSKYGPKLYHYTSYDALVGILQNKEIWMGNAASMNDRSEMQLLTDSLQKALLEDMPSDKLYECQALFDSVRHALKKITHSFFHYLWRKMMRLSGIAILTMEKVLAWFLMPMC